MSLLIRQSARNPVSVHCPPRPSVHLGQRSTPLVTNPTSLHSSDRPRAKGDSPYAARASGSDGRRLTWVPGTHTASLRPTLATCTSQPLRVSVAMVSGCGCIAGRLGYHGDKPQVQNVSVNPGRGHDEIEIRYSRSRNAK